MSAAATGWEGRGELRQEAEGRRGIKAEGRGQKGIKAGGRGQRAEGRGKDMG